MCHSDPEKTQDLYRRKVNDRGDESRADIEAVNRSGDIVSDTDFPAQL
jgi:hypothetical protein